jgi:hypothetical protein
MVASAWYDDCERIKRMTTEERVIANKDFIDGIEVRVAAIERELPTGARIEPVVIGCSESEIDFVWPMGFEEDRVRLRALRMRLNNVKRLNPPEPELPPPLHMFG